MVIIPILSRRLVLFSSIVFCLLVAGATEADAQTTREKVIEHLEFLGYTCETVAQGIKTTHPTKFGFVLVELLDGFIVQSAFAGTPLDKGDTSRFAAVNTLNAGAAIARFFWDDSGRLVLRAWFPGGYDKARFTPFMEAWEQDSLTVRTQYESLKPYLK